MVSCLILRVGAKIEKARGDSDGVSFFNFHCSDSVWYVNPQLGLTKWDIHLGLVGWGGTLQTIRFWVQILVDTGYFSHYSATFSYSFPAVFDASECKKLAI